MSFSSDPVIPEPLGKDEVLKLLMSGACIQRDRHGAAVIRIEGRCRDDWEELRLAGWLNMTTSGTYVLSERGLTAIGITEKGR